MIVCNNMVSSFFYFSPSNKLVLVLMEKEQTVAPGAGLIYGLNDRPPVKETIFAALQHLLAIFVAIITPPLIIAGALKLDLETTGFLVSMALFASGISTFIQCRRVGPVGCGLLCIQGTSFSFIGPIISAGLTGGLSTIFGACIVASSVEMLISRVLKYTRRIITPLVSGIVVTLIGMSLIKGRYFCLWRWCRCSGKWNVWGHTACGTCRTGIGPDYYFQP